MRFLVTGANGLVGSRLCAQLAQKGHSVTGVARGPQRGTPPAGDYQYRTCELTSEPEVAAAFLAARPDAAIHTASMTEVDACEKDRDAAYAANVSAAAYVAKSARAASCHLVHVSTDYVFDGDRGPYSEEDVPNPRGVYAITKHMGEQAARVHVPTCAIARTAVVFGFPPAGRPNFGVWLVGSLEKKQPTKLFEDQVVSPSLADNVAAMLAELAERKLPGTWNTCGATVLDRVSIGKRVCEVFGFDPALIVPTKMRDLNLPSPRPYKSGLTTDKAARELSAKPLSLADALQRFHADYRRGNR